MSTEVKLPQLGFTMAEGAVTEWLVKDGAAVTVGKPIFMLEAEKAVQEIEAPVSGIIRIMAREGETYPVGTTLAIID